MDDTLLNPPWDVDLGTGGAEARPAPEAGDIFRQAPSAMALVDAGSGVVLAANDVLAALLGAAPEDLVGELWPSPLGSEPSGFASIAGRIPEHGMLSFEEPVARSGNITWWRQHLTRVKPPAAEPYLIVQVEDRTVEHRHTTELESQARRDELTGAWNRRQFGQEMRRLLGEDGAGAVGVLLYDVDRFKHVNDTYGHLVGDEALVAVANRLRAASPPGALVARLAGDEFAVVLTQPTLAEAERACRALAQATRTVKVSPPLRQVLLSAGWSVTSPGVDPDRRAHDAMVEADVAMYATKSRARTVVPGLDDVAPLGRSWLNESEARPSHEVWAQPILDVDRHRQVMVDVVVAPADRSGAEPAATAGLDLDDLIDLLDLIRRDSRRQVARPQDYLLHLPGFPIGAAAAVGWVRRAAEDSGLSPSAITFALSESALTQAGPGAIQVLTGIRAAGFGVAVDDFGASVASLRLLADLPFDQLWLHPSLVTSVTDGAASEAVVQAAVLMARTRSALVGVVEPPETAMGVLGRLGVDRYLIRRPDELRPLGAIGGP